MVVAVTKHVWTYWISYPLVAGALLAVVATIAGYLKKMQALKNPKR